MGPPSSRRKSLASWQLTELLQEEDATHLRCDGPPVSRLPGSGCVHACVRGVHEGGRALIGAAQRGHDPQIDRDLATAPAPTEDLGTAPNDPTDWDAGASRGGAFQCGGVTV